MASPLTFSPLVSAAVWLSTSAYLVVRQQYRTWTERFFLALCLCAASYAISDTVFFLLGDGASTAIDPSKNFGVDLAASLSLASITVAGLFLFLYGLSLASRFRRWYLLAIVPTALFLPAFPTEMFQSFAAPTASSPVINPVYNPVWLYPWLLFVGAIWLIGLLGVTRTFFEIRKQNAKLANRIGAILAGLAIAVVAGAATNALVAVNVAKLPPLFSTFLAIPGIFVLFAVTPASIRGFNAAILRRRAHEYEVKGAFLTFSDGTLIGSKTAPEEEMIDADSFSATLDVIQNFMRTSFPTLRGKWLKAIRHGDYTLLMERGQYAYLTLMISGSENDPLRRSMIEHLEDFEATNKPKLEHWRGIAADAVGVERMLESLLTVGGPAQA